MASKKQQRTESKQGLVITLVFFILTTIGLGVATYYGFAEQESLQKAAKDAKKNEDVFKAERDWYRFQAHLYRTYMGHPPQHKDFNAKDLARDKAALDKKQLTMANAQKDKDDVSNFVENTLNKAMPWDAAKDDAPALTYERRLDGKDRAYAALEKNANQLKEDKEAAERRAKDADELAKTEQKGFQAKLLEQAKKIEQDRATDRNTIANLQKDLTKAGEDRDKAKNAAAAAETALAKTKGELVKAEGQLADLRRHQEDLKGELSKKQAQLALVSEKSGLDVGALEAQALDARALELLRNWRKDWQIVQMDRKGTNPYINLGSADKVVPQLTFSIHARGPDGRLSPNPKGALEVVRVVGPHLSRVRVTAVKDPKADPILKGDRLFNPTWDPSLRKHVAVAGLIDLTGDGTDSTAELVRMLQRQGTVVDAYVDLNEKEPVVKGKGITVSTDYLIVGDPVEGSRHPQARGNPDFVKKVDGKGTGPDGKDAGEVEKLKRKARENGVTIIGLRKYLDMIGYRSPRLAAESGGARP
jgi:hypothetical protein